MYNGDPEFHTTIGRIIVRKFRSIAPKQALRTSFYITFLEFVKYVINLGENGADLGYAMKVHCLHITSM